VEQRASRRNIVGATSIPETVALVLVAIGAIGLLIAARGKR
jgi:hypothetical protein